MEMLLLAVVAVASVGGALALALCFHARWYWHVLSIAAAMGIGLIPGLTLPDLLVGGVFLFLLFWGIAPALFRLVPKMPSRTQAATWRILRSSSSQTLRRSGFSDTLHSCPNVPDAAPITRPA